MKMKSFVLGAAAVLAATGANAADLASKKPAEAADYVKICDAYGAGYFYIPGGETCLKIGGYVRYDLLFGINSDKMTAGSRIGGGWSTRAGNGTFTRTRAQVNFDARTNTEAGLLRSYINLQFNADSAGTGGLTVDRAFIQWAGITAGRTASMFDFWTGNAAEPIFGTSTSDRTTNLLAYTAQFGNGISATLSVEDGTFRRVGGAYGGHKLPELVANVNVTQAWGRAQIMAAVHQAYDGGVAGTPGVSTWFDADGDNVIDAGEVTTTAAKAGRGPAGSKAGYAVGAGATFNLPFLGAGSTATLQGAYAAGALDYLGLGGNDYVVSGGSVKLTKGWSIAAGVNAVITKQVALALDASYAQVDPFGASNTTKQWDVASTLVYTATPGLLFSVSVDYRNTKVGAAPATDAVAGGFRVQRTF